MRKIQIAVASDENYLSHSLVSLMSVLDCCNEEVTIHFLGDGVSTDSRKKLDAVCSLYKNANIEFHDVTKTLPNIDTLKFWTKVALARMYLPEIVNGRILYLDVDTFTQADVSWLFDLDLQNNCVVAVRDFGILGSLRKQNLNAEKLRNHVKKIMDPFPEYDYFNSGVMLIDCDKIKKSKALNNAFTDIDTVVADQSLLYPDQDHLNISLKGHVRFINPSWNSIYGMTGRALRVAKTVFPPELVHKPEYPKIIHYAGNRKPWNPFKLRSLTSTSYVTRFLGKDIAYKRNANRMLKLIREASQQEGLADQYG